MASTQEVEQAKVYSRRAALTLFAEAAAVTAVAVLTPQKESRLGKALEGTDPNPKSLAETVWETVQVNAVTNAVYGLASGLGIPVGNAGVREELKAMAEAREKAFYESTHGLSDPELTRQNFIASALAIADFVLPMPLREEAVFRFAPVLAMNDQSQDKRWDWGVPVTLAFGLAHNLFRNRETGKTEFDFKTIPLAQVILGAYYWSVNRERGLMQATVSHAVSNLTSIFPLSLVQIAGEKVGESIRKKITV